nr:hypothetical protein [Kibdelosporangium sp. MJ126-NF4]
MAAAAILPVGVSTASAAPVAACDADAYHFRFGGIGRISPGVVGFKGTIYVESTGPTCTVNGAPTNWAWVSDISGDRKPAAVSVGNSESTDVVVSPERGAYFEIWWYNRSTTIGGTRFTMPGASTESMVPWDWTVAPQYSASITPIKAQ